MVLCSIPRQTKEAGIDIRCSALITVDGCKGVCWGMELSRQPLKHQDAKIPIRMLNIIYIWDDIILVKPNEEVQHRNKNERLLAFIWK